MPFLVKSLGAFFIALSSILIALPAHAAEYSPGQVCTVSGAMHTMNNSGGANILICDGGTWNSAISFFSAGGLGISSLSGHPPPLSGGSTAGGGDTQVQYNDGGSTLAGDANLVWNKTSQIFTVNGNIEYTGVMTDISDRRLKENIEPLDHSLERIIALQGVSYTLKQDDQARPELGFIAQDVEAHFPALVHTKDDGLKSLNYIGLVAPLVEAVKEQQATIEKLNARIEALEKSNAPTQQARQKPADTGKSGHNKRSGNTP